MDEKQLKERLAKMTLQEKLLEMTQFNFGALGLGQGELLGVPYDAGLDEKMLIRMGSVVSATSAEVALNYRKARKEMGLKEPGIMLRDIIHGCRTVYPIPLAMAGSFDLQLMEDCAEMAAMESKYDGVDVTAAPMVDLVRDARWGRVMESGGEDPYLSGEMGKAFIRGYHKAGVGVCVKHFAGYGAAEAGKDYNTTDISEHSMREYYLRPYQACMEENPEMVMSAFNALNGIPFGADTHYMVDVLRKEWGWDGVIVSDWGSIQMMRAHGYAQDLKACALAAIKTKHDVEMCSTAFWEHIPALIEEGLVREAEVDEAVLRIMKLRDRLGLYENPDGHADPQKRDELMKSEKYRALARRAAEESCILLKNDGTLPLKKSENVAFVGPCFDSKELIGNWGGNIRINEADIVTVKMGVEKLLGKEITAKEGCTTHFLDTDCRRIDEAVESVKNAAVIVACVGEPRLGSGEHHSRADIRITKVQRKLIKKLAALNKKLVLVVFGGRPQALKEVEPHANAILYAWQPGVEGGSAIANLLYGKVNPSGKAAMSFPRSVGQCPIYYNHFHTGHAKHDDSVIVSNTTFNAGSCYDDEYNSPLYPFGYGLSYTSFAYSGLKLSQKTVKVGGKITASVKVKNTGKCDGKEVVQWYIRDKVASFIRPVKELKGFEKIFLKAGEEKTVTFTITEAQLAFYKKDGAFTAEPGDFTLFVGGNSRDCLEEEFVLVE